MIPQRNSTPLLVGLLYLNSYFFYDNVYSKRRKFVYSMRDSFAHRMDLLIHVGMVVCYSVLSDFSPIWYRLGRVMRDVAARTAD